MGLLTVCRRKSLLWLHPPSRSRSLLLQRGNTLSGSEDPSLLPSPPSSRCGSPSRSTTNAAHPLSTASASKLSFSCVIHITFHSKLGVKITQTAQSQGLTSFELHMII